jgi:hypothetical protein
VRCSLVNRFTSRAGAKWFEVACITTRTVEEKRKENRKKENESLLNYYCEEKKQSETIKRLYPFIYLRVQIKWSVFYYE